MFDIIAETEISTDASLESFWRRWKGRDPRMTSCIIEVQFKRNICIYTYAIIICRNSEFSFFFLVSKDLAWMFKKKKKVQRQPVFRSSSFHLCGVKTTKTIDVKKTAHLARRFQPPVWMFPHPSLMSNHRPVRLLVPVKWSSAPLAVILRPSEIHRVEKYQNYYLLKYRLAIEIVVIKTNDYKHTARAKWISCWWLMAACGRKLHFLPLMKSEGSPAAFSTIALMHHKLCTPAPTSTSVFTSNSTSSSTSNSIFTSNSVLI